MSIENLETEIGTLRAKLAEAERERDRLAKELRDVVDAGVKTLRKAQEERDQWKNAATARLALDERVRAIVRMLGENPASVEAIESLGMRVNEAERKRDRYRAALRQYAGPVNWQVRDSDGEEREWIGEGSGPDLAEKALAGAEESEGK